MLVPAASDPTPAFPPWVVCLDLQRDRSEAAPSPDLRGRIVACQRLLAHARRASWPLVHVLQGAEQVSPEAPRADRLAPIEGLQPRPFEPVLFRTGLSAFSNRRFRDLVAGGRRHVVLVGVALGPACLATALDAHDRGIPVTLVEDTLTSGATHLFPAETVRGVLLGVASPYVRRVTSTRVLQLGAALAERPAANDW